MTNTPTPSAPTLISVSISVSSVPLGSNAVLNYTLFSPTGGTYALGADINSGTNQYTDPGNDRLVTVPAGTSSVSCNSTSGPTTTRAIQRGVGLWDTGFVTSYSTLSRPNGLTISNATPTPSAGIPTYTPTIVPTPNPPGLSLDVTQPMTVTVNPGGTINLSYRVINNTGAPVSVKLGASMVPSGQGGVGVVTELGARLGDNGGDGYKHVYSPVRGAGARRAGSYDFTFSLLNPSNNNVLSTRMVANLVWVVPTTVYTGSMT